MLKIRFMLLLCLTPVFAQDVKCPMNNCKACDARKPDGEKRYSKYCTNVCTVSGGTNTCKCICPYACRNSKSNTECMGTGLGCNPSDGGCRSVIKKSECVDDNCTKLKSKALLFFPKVCTGDSDCSAFNCNKGSDCKSTCYQATKNKYCKCVCNNEVA